MGDGVGLLELNVSDGVIAKQTNFSDKDGITISHFACLFTLMRYQVRKQTIDSE